MFDTFSVIVTIDGEQSEEPPISLREVVEEQESANDEN